MQELTKALIKAQQGFKPISKDRTNPHYKTKYATLDSVLTAVNESLWANGLTVMQTVDTVDGKTVLQTHLMHESGECKVSNYPLPELTDPQKMGAAVTYARRYSLCGILNVTADEDDDGNAAKPVQSVGPSKITAKQVEEMTSKATTAGYTMDGLKALLAEFGFKSRQLVTVDKYQAILNKASNPEFAQQYNPKTEAA